MAAFDLHLLRHGEPDLAGCLLGRADSPATAAGVDICLAAVEKLKVERIISSPLSRARAAGEMIAAVHGLPLVVDDRWQELDFGEWDARKVADISLAESDALGRFWDDPENCPPPGGERWSSLHARVGEALRDLSAAAWPSLIVSHGGAIRAAIGSLCGFDYRHLWAFDLPYAALVSLRVHVDGARLAAMITGLRAP